MVKSDGRHWFRCGGRRHSDANLDKPIAGASARNVVCPPGLPCVAFLSAALVSAGKRRGVIRGGFPSQPPTRKEKKKHNKKERGRAPADNSSQTGQNQVSQEGGWVVKKKLPCSRYYCIFSVAGFSQSAAQQQQTGTLLPPQAIQQLYLHPLLSL